MKKVLLIQPPQWYPVSPHLAVPLLAAQIKREGFEVKALDLNVKFFNRILHNKNLAEADRQAKRILAELEEKFANADFEAIKKNGSFEEKNSGLKYLTIKKFYDGNGDEIERVINETDQAVHTLKNAPDFYCPEKLMRAKRTVQLALRLASMPYAPNEIDIDNYFANPLLRLDWENIKLQCEASSLNMFRDFLAEKASEISEQGYYVIGVSMTDLSQLIPVFTLTKMLKAQTNAKIILGGNYATQISEDMLRHEDIFTDYIDYLLIGDAETAIVDLCKYIDGREKIENVANLSYYSESEKRVVSASYTCEHIDLNGVAYPDFSDYDFSEYLTPEPVFPIQLSKGCYWGKCSFCDYAYGQLGYDPKRIDRIIDEIKYYIDTYSASKFMFIDEAIPPAFYNRLALAIIKSGLKINYYSFARLEDGYTAEVLKNLYDSGARIFMWGYECESLRVMKLMNKGINSERRLDILADSHRAGIWNNGLFIFGYPTETADEIRQTMDVIRNNRDIINSCTLSNFSLKKHSLLKETVGSNGIISYTENGEFFTTYRDEAQGISQAERRELRRSFQFEMTEANKNFLWSVVFSDFDHLLLYLSKYGLDYVSGYRSDERICPEFR